LERILIIEDDKDIRDSIAEVLEVEGYEVASAANGQEGMDYLRGVGAGERLPDAILLDLMMPVMNGMQFRAAQLSEPKYAEIPVIVMSADNRAVQKSEEMRSAMCILKPLEIDDLVSALNRLLKK
jgi:CheY-like chemotaxis protein